MFTIEPCCSHRQMSNLRKSIENGGTAEFQGYGDMSLTELLPALLTYYNETELLIVAPSLPDQAAEVIMRWARHQWARIDGSGNFYTLRHLTIIADLTEEQSPMASQWLKKNPFGERMTLVNKAQDDTVILLRDIAITGPLNLCYGNNFICTVTTSKEQVHNLWERYVAAGKEEPAQTDKEEPAGQEVKPVKKSAKKRKSSSAGKSKR